MRSLLLGAAAVALVGLAACDPPPARRDAPDVRVDDGDNTPITPEDTTRGRDRRRMDIDQLSASIEQVTGGLRWMDGDVDQFEALSGTLGKPDYVNNTQEDLDPSLLFQKFLDDAAADVCSDLMAREAASPEVFLVNATLADTWDNNPDAVKANLAYLVLRFHGRQLDPDSATLEPWTWLFRTSLQVTGDPQDSWKTVCVGLMTHPDFYTY